ncbi:MAG: ATP-dependent nuclease [Bacteriovorax sp.]
MKIRHLNIENFRGIKSLNTPLQGNFICLIGHGDNCKSTILSAIDLVLSTRWNVVLDDSDFYNQTTTSPILISVTLSEWDEEDEKIKKFFSEDKFGQFIGGLTGNGPETEPTENKCLSLTIQLTVDKSLEPKWCVIKGSDSKSISSSERSIFGIGRIDAYLDNNFTWSRNSLLTKISGSNEESIAPLLADISRNIRDRDLDLGGCNTLAALVKTDAIKFGVYLDELKPKVDIQKISLASGALALHQGNIPLRNFGTGSKKLVSCSMQMKVHNGKNITLIDELELGLEPHRIRGLIKNLKASGQQIITTTHSPVVLRELVVDKNEIYTCKSNGEGKVAIKSFNTVPDSQGPLRSNAEAFLGRKIIVCEGATEVGCLRALDQIKAGQGMPVWTLNTAYYNANGIGNIKSAAIALKGLGYEVSVLCDNDEPDAFTAEDQKQLADLAIPIFLWDEGCSIENQLFKDLTWNSLHGLMSVIATNHDSKDLQDLVAAVRSKDGVLDIDLTKWIESPYLRTHIGAASAGKGTNGKSDGKKSWFKRIDYSEEAFKFSIPVLSDGSVMKKKLDELWAWVQK